MAETKTLEIRTGRSRPVGIWHLFAGIIMAALGVYVWFNPVATMVALALYIGIIFIILGAGYITASFRYDSGWDMFVGVLDILVGVIQLVVAYQFRKAQVSWGWTLTSGILGILFAFLILSYPAVGVITITALMGTYILLFGILEIAEYTTNNRSLVIEADNL